jgi:2-keto-myo-inositol isomerase
VVVKGPINFALNHITAPRLSCRAFVDLAAQLGCVGVELRNDLADKQLTDRRFFDDEQPNEIGEYVRKKGIRLLGLSEIYGFNKWSDEMQDKTARLIDQAKQAGAETISLIPSNDGDNLGDATRLDNLRRALSHILPMLDATNMIALVEPLGFTTSSLRYKREAVDAIRAVQGEARFKLVHDTFHHFLAGEREFFPDQTGIVHISGVVDPMVAPESMQDGHRILVTTEDRLGNIEQIRSLRESAYSGPYSYECFAAAVHASPNLERELRASIQLVQSGLSATAQPDVLAT